MASKNEDITDFGSQATSSESSEEVSLIQDLERELGAVVQRHRIPPDELQQLFEVKKNGMERADCTNNLFSSSPSLSKSYINVSMCNC